MTGHKKGLPVNRKAFGIVMRKMLSSNEQHLQIRNHRCYRFSI